MNPFKRTKDQESNKEWAAVVPHSDCSIHRLASLQGATSLLALLVYWCWVLRLPCRLLLVWKLLHGSACGKGVGKTLSGVPHRGSALLLSLLVLRGRPLQKLLLVQHLCRQLALHMRVRMLSAEDMVPQMTTQQLGMQQAFSQKAYVVLLTSLGMLNAWLLYPPEEESWLHASSASWRQSSVPLRVYRQAVCRHICVPHTGPSV